MRPLLSTLLLALLLTSLFVAPAAAQDQASPADPAMQAPVDTTAQVNAARNAAQSWLALADAQNYEQGWETASQMLKDKLTQEQWAQAGRQVQAQVGALQSRSFARAQYTTSLPGLPEGQYVLLFYGSQFENASAQEIMVMRQEDGAWKAAGYNVRPQQQMQQDDGQDQR